MSRRRALAESLVAHADDGIPSVTEPGVYDGLPDHVYHLDPVPAGSLSSGGARRLLPPSCPALFRHWQVCGQAPARELDLGRAAHMLTLGAGPDLVCVEAADWRTKAAREQRDAAYAAGAVPLLAADMATVKEMARALLAHPIAAALFGDGGQPEQSLFWVDAEFGCWRRGRLDWLPAGATPAGRLVIPDYKTCASAAPGALAKSMASYGYHQQAAWYLDGVAALGLAEAAAFVFVSQETRPPYLVHPWQPEPDAVTAGRVANRKALDVWMRCRAADDWPGYGDEVATIALPAWEQRRYETAWLRGDYEIGEPE